MPDERMMTVVGADAMSLYCIECPTHGGQPVGFFQQLPYVIAPDKKSVTVTVKCHKCDFSRTHTYDLKEKQMIHEIHPYICDETAWNGERVWVFDDPSKGLKNEGLVSGTDVILDQLSATFPDGEKGFTLKFSDEPFDGSQFRFDWVREGTGEGLAEGTTGNWYTQQESGFNGWLCPALFLYFDTAPAHIYVKAEPLQGTLERGTGRVVIQGKVQ